MKFKAFARIAAVSGISFIGIVACGGREPGQETEGVGLSASSHLSIESAVAGVAGGTGAPSGPACGVTLIATLVFHGSQRIDGTTSLAQPMSFALPAAIPITTGGTKNGHAQLQLSLKGGASVTCNYDLQGGGQSFSLSSCNDGKGAGAIESADSFVLHIQTADHGAGASGDEIQLTALLDAPNGTECAGGNRCFQAYACQAGQCTGSSPVICSASDQCHTAGTCDPSHGTCSNPAATNGAACNDGNRCDLNDACQDGVCAAGSPVVCAPSDACHVAGTCQSWNGQCSNPTGNDGAACGSSPGYVCNAGACDSGCYIAGTFYLAGARGPDGCQSCQPETSTSEWSTAADGSDCYLPSNLGNRGICAQGTCQGCGTSGELCCSYDASNSCYQSTCDNGTCQCGAQDQQCCGGTSCGANLACLVTSGSTATCQCGSQIEPCCGGNSCGPNLTCSALYENAQFQPVYLCNCGTAGVACCGGYYCDASASCTNGMCVGNGLLPPP